MLVCPQCQFDNPNHNLFCQNCGGSLTHNHCQECGEKVVFSEENCSACGHPTGVRWWVLIFDGNTREKFHLSVGNYLDMGKRYRILVTDTEKEAEFDYWRGTILDCQPLHKSVLQILLGDQEEEQALSWLPELAIPYLRLQDFSPAVPPLHEAWQEGERQIIIAENRSDWQILSEILKKEHPPILQLVYWFDEMAKLWKSLAEVNCCQSLLIKENLRLDEDQTFGLQQLFSDDPDCPPTLCELALLWQDFLPHNDDFQTFSLQKLLTKTINGEIDTITELRLQLQELGDEDRDYEENTGDLQDASQQSLNVSIPTNHEDYLITRPNEITLIDKSEGEDQSTAVIPMQLLSLSEAGNTDNGRSRRHNEDYFGISTEIRKQQNNRGQKIQGRGLYIVCDGMGGHAAGEVASALAVETLQKYFDNLEKDSLPNSEAIEQGILLANKTIYQVNQDKESYGSGRMGTTLVLALVQDTTLAIANVGDSRIYRVNRKWGLEQLTTDHEVGQRAIQDGIDPKIAYSRPDAYQLTQALGPHDDNYVKPDIRFFEIQEDTILLLCSDGLSDNELVENHWQTHLSPLLSSSSNLEEGLSKLMNLANQNNGHDNITAVLVRLKVQPNLEPSIWL
jgi:protein phosphatase